MEVLPTEVGKVSRSWDEQHLDLLAAAAQIGAAPTDGFPPGVSAAAAAFVAAYERHTTTAATLAEQQADGLRVTIADWLATDARAGADSLVLTSYLRELR